MFRLHRIWLFIALVLAACNLNQGVPTAISPLERTLTPTPNLPDCVQLQTIGDVTLLLLGGAELVTFEPEMRAITLRTDNALEGCEVTRSALLLQSPDSATLTINGAMVTFNAAVYLTATPNDALTVGVLAGGGSVEAFGLQREISEGTQVSVPLRLASGLLAVGAPTEPEDIPAYIRDALPLTLLPQTEPTPTPTLIFPTSSAPTATSVPFFVAPPTVAIVCLVRADWTDVYVIARGDTLFRIAQRYELSVVELQSGNCLEDPDRITVGETLRVPRIATPTPAASVTPSPLRYRADEEQVIIGGCTVIRWDIDNIDSIFFDGAPTTGHDSRKVCPQQTTTYNLRIVYRDGAQVQNTLTVSVRPAPTATATRSLPPLSR